jgi:tRNA U34 2-thiouridine synthase MnmA/TrmU
LKIRGIALFSGGLDSILAVKVIQEQGIEVTGVSFETPFFGADKARKAAAGIGLDLIVMDITEEHLVMLKNPRYGYGKNMNPCIDCHILMLKKAGDRMRQVGADFLLTGEVLGQRPMSQGKQSLHVVAKRSGYQEYAIRPLSARLLPETLPEKEGKVIREKLLDIQGRSRKRQMELVDKYKITHYEQPGGGCLLTNPGFSKRLKDLFDCKKPFDIRDIQLLKFGRHLRLNDKVKIIVGRNKKDNQAIRDLLGAEDAVIEMKDFPGPTVLVPHTQDEDVIRFASAVCVFYSKPPCDTAVVRVCGKEKIVDRAAVASDIESIII